MASRIPIILATAILAASFGVPTTIADGECAGSSYLQGGGTDEDAIPILPIVGTLAYVRLNGIMPEVWMEENNVEGLQDSARERVYPNDPSGECRTTIYGSDTNLLMSLTA